MFVLLSLVSIAVVSAPHADPAIAPILVVYGAAPGSAFNGPMGIAIDSKRGEILVANSGDHRIEIFDLKGRLRAHYFHKIRTRDGSVMRGIPAAILIDRAGRTLLVDQLAGYVDVLDFRGRSLAHLDLSQSATGNPAALRPSGIAVTPSGDILVSAAGDSGRVYRFDGKYRPQGWWGHPGKDGSGLAGITGLSVLPDGNVVVASVGTRFGVQIFSASGELVKSFGPHDVGPGNFSLPSSVVTTADGRIWVSDGIRHVIEVFDSGGEYLGEVGGQGVSAGSFLNPSALASDGRNYLAVSERTGNRIQLLRFR